MPAKDIYHHQLKNALIKDGWTITDDPLILSIGKKDLFVDLGAEKIIAAEKNNRKIAAEIKSFVGRSQINDLENAVGQYMVYLQVLLETKSERILYLAIRQSSYQEVFEETIGKIFLKKKLINLIVFDEHKESILQWID
ncbi:MAG: element excision factor XisH family protein [Spirulinaceae cyanobacterium]